MGLAGPVTPFGMTLFDWAAGLVLLVSGLMGFARGATREVTTVIALVLAAVVAIFAVRFTGPVARHFVSTAWIANTLAILIGFVIAYILLRMVGGALTRSVQQTALSGLDRVLGFAIGLVRGLLVLGVFALVINAATPREKMPAWITRARLYPLAAAAGGVLRAFAPQGLKVAHDVAPAMADAVTGEALAPPVAEPRPQRRDHGAQRGYSDEQRRALDDLVEKSR